MEIFVHLDDTYKNNCLFYVPDSFSREEINDHLGKHLKYWYAWDYPTKKDVGEVIKECRWESFRAAGGMNVGAMERGVRLIHEPSGTDIRVGGCRAQFQNRAMAIEMLMAGIKYYENEKN
jgi:protein subunit release factor B